MYNRFGTLCRVALLLAVIGTAADLPTCAQPRGTRQIPPDTPDDVRHQIERLLSDDLTVGIDAARNLGEMGGRAMPAVPFLMDYVRDPEEVDRTIAYIDRHPSYTQTVIKNQIALGKEALSAIGKIGAPAVAPLMTLLGQERDYRKFTAPLAFAEIGEPAVEPLVEELMTDREPSGSRLAAEALGRIGEPGLEPLLSALQSDDFWTRSDAVHGLGYIRDARAVEALIGVLGVEDRSYGLNQRTASSLGRIGTLAVGPLITVLQAEDPKVRTNAARALGYVGDARAVGPLARVLGDEETSVRYAAVVAFGQIKNESTVEPLIAVLGDKDADIRSMAAFELGQKQDSRAVEPLARVLHGDGISDVRSAAAGALGLIKDIRAVRPLIRALNDRDKWVVGGAATALSEIGDSRAVEPLIAVLAENDAGGWTEAVIELAYGGRMTAKSRVIVALGSFEDTRAVDILIVLLKDGSSETRRCAAEALGTIGDSTALGPLTIALKDDVVDVRGSAVRALAELDEPRAVRLVVPMLHDDDRGVRESAAEALANIGPPAIEPLIESLKKRDDTFLRRSKRAFGTLREGFSLEKMAASYVDTDPYDSNYFAAQALRQITGRHLGGDYSSWRIWYELKRDDLSIDDMPGPGGR